MKLTVDIWRDEGWYLGKARELPGVFTQGKSLKEVTENLADACKLLLAEGDGPGPDDIGVPSPSSKPPCLQTSVRLQLPEDVGGNG
jgi:predicted RNase H-like HicB family nuclease